MLSATANDPDGAIVRVEFYEGPVLLGLATNPPYAFVWSNAPVGVHTLMAKALRSPHHHAAIRRLDTSKAERLPGVRAVVTHEDVPKNVYGHLEALGIPADEPLLAMDDVRYRGQPIAAVAAGQVAVVDVRVEPGYSAVATAAMLRGTEKG